MTDPTSRRHRPRLAAPLLAVVALALAALAHARWGRDAGTSVSAAYAELNAVHSDPDSTVRLPELATRLERCRALEASTPREPPRAQDLARGVPAVGGCAGAIYVWSPSMPLSRSGLREIAVATRDLGVDLAILRASDLYEHVESTRLDPAATADSDGPASAADDDSTQTYRRLAAQMVALGATLHYPSVLLHGNGALHGSAIVGYKTAETYRTLLRGRLGAATPAHPVPAPEPPAGGGWARGEPAEPNLPFAIVDEYAYPGAPGAYFRFVAGRNMIAFENGGVIHLLDLSTGETVVGPGFIDLIPSPDGRLFVTPGRNGAGLAFYDAAAVIEAASRGAGQAVEPIFVDPGMRDQYPSVGILGVVSDDDSRRTTYRVLTSWFERVVFRDYEVTTAPLTDRALRVRPLGRPTIGCPEQQVSLPIMAQDGRELAGRDESSATTKIFRLDDDGGCTAVLDLEAQTGKVAWSADGRRIAFAIPAGARSGERDRPVSPAEDGADRAGVFVFDRDDMRATRLPGTQTMRRLTIPELADSRSVVLLLAGERNDSSVFRVVCCVP